MSSAGVLSAQKSNLPFSVEGSAWGLDEAWRSLFSSTFLTLETQNFVLSCLTFPQVPLLLLRHETNYKSRGGENLSSGLGDEIKPMAFHFLAQSVLSESTNSAHGALHGSSKHKRCLAETTV